MSEYVAIWLAGIVLVAVLFGVVAAVLRFSASARANEISLGDVFKVLALVVGVSCAVYTLLALLLS